MKLNTKNTVLVGFAFLSICAFWQMYDNVIPLILSNTFAIDKTLSGGIMAADNVLALFLLPLFGGLSDRCTAKIGRRKPFLIGGTLSAVLLMIGLPLLDNAYYASPSAGLAVGFIVLLGLLLIAMGTYRSPAVALMPDITPKPLRSKGNAIINLMGAIGGVLYLGITAVLYSKSRTGHLDHVNYLPLFLIVGGIMLASLLVVCVCINEPKLAAKQAEYEAAHPEDQLSETDEHGKTFLPKAVKMSLAFVLLSVALWFIGYNAVTTWFTTYATGVWGMALGDASLCLTVASVGAIVSYIPVGVLAERIGRKKTILGGAALLSTSFLTAFVYTLVADAFHPALFVVFALVGVAWAAINVNSLPMVIEMCAGGDVGKFTGLYYTFSMSAQIITPMLSGYLYDHVSEQSLFLYAAVFVALSFVTMLFVRHGDNRPNAKRGLEAFDVED
ncbi:MAG: MFS transporter [Clostridia bacterium]|nr:MFS transporter [Clostridia bacterium]